MLDTLLISTHTPVRVWLEAYAISLIENKDFNSHTREGVTKNDVQFLCVFWHFNSHTREGVTGAVCAVGGFLTFQLTHPWGCDCLRVLLMLKQQKFQLTHPWGCDKWYCAVIWRRKNFNSHTREGVTGTKIKDIIIDVNFNSHTREGVTEQGHFKTCW